MAKLRAPSLSKSWKVDTAITSRKTARSTSAKIAMKKSLKNRPRRRNTKAQFPIKHRGRQLWTSQVNVRPNQVPMCRFNKNEKTTIASRHHLIKALQAQRILASRAPMVNLLPSKSGNLRRDNSWDNAKSAESTSWYKSTIWRVNWLMSTSKWGTDRFG